MEVDGDLMRAVVAEEDRQHSQIELLAPKNYASRATREAFASIVSFTTIEGYPGRRFHAGMVNLDAIERLAIDRAKQLFGCSYANVQPHSGTQANQAVFYALLESGDNVLSMSLRDGGHLSHGLRSNFSGKWFNVANYGVDKNSGLIDYDAVREIARKHRPKLMVVGGSSYPRRIDFERFKQIADECGSYLLADISHFSGLVAGGVHESPFPHAHVVTSTTNKNLRGPRGGIILCDDEGLGKKLDSALFPGIQGGPLPEYISAKAVAFKEALSVEFKEYAQAVLRNARTFCSVLSSAGYDIVTGGTDTPLVMVDLRSVGLTGDVAAESLEAAGIPCNKNLVPGDPEGPRTTSGLRFGLSAVTTRGFRDEATRDIAEIVVDVLDGVRKAGAGDAQVEKSAKDRVELLARRYPIYLRA
ncbi:serine hydroxymethyltransferase [Streptomyces sp. GD-15H]|uniref:serine hydroxymethyltransferase n=1 Tax=Streptomyces sp. GD-15H TaxID=3129112 RepID=UPI003255135E